MAARNKIEFVVSVVDRASTKLDGIKRRFAAFGKAIAANAARIGAAFTAAGVALVAFANRITKEFDRLAKFSDLTGASVEAISRLEFAAARSGVALQTLSVGIRGMTRNIGDAATGIGEAVDAFRALNVSAADLNKLEFDQQLLVLADAFAAVESGTQRLVIAQDIFGGRAAEILKIFKRGAQGIRDYADEVNKLGGTVTTSAAESSARYQDSLTNLSAAFTGLKVALVDSGVIDGLAKFTDNFAKFVARVSGNDLAGDLLNASLQVAALKAQIDRIQNDNKPGGDRLLKGLRETLAEAELRYDTLLLKQGELLDKAKFGIPSVGGADPKIGGTTNPLQSFIDSFDTAQQEIDKKMEKLRLAIAEGLVPDEADQKRIAAEIQSIATEGIEEIHITTKKRFSQIADAFDPVKEAAKQAFRSIQQAMADFLFDPFQDGIKGMLKGFIDIIRRMIAEIAAAQLIKKLFGEGSTFEKIVGSIFGRASGGPTAAGQTVRVHEGELVTFGSGGGNVTSRATQQTMNGQTPTFVTNIDARGADPGLISRLPLIMEQRDRQLLLKMKRYIETGMLPA